MLPALGTQTSMYKKEEDKTQNLENDYVTIPKSPYSYVNMKDHILKSKSLYVYRFNH